MTISRKKFLQLSALTSAALMAPGILHAFGRRQQVQTDGRILIVLQLTGGNDSLSTIIPFRNDLYYRARPQLAINAGAVLRLDSELGLHPALKGLYSLYENGELCMLNGIGYPQPERSHARSLNTWHTGGSAAAFNGTGWLGRYLDQQTAISTAYLPLAVELNNALSLSMKGTTQAALATPASGQEFNAECHTVSYPNTPLAARFKAIANMIRTGAATKIYHLSHEGFDTHVNQLAQQANLFTQMDEAVLAFVKDMKMAGRMDDVLLVTLSEFGRRVAENASGGTDHGTAGSMFVIGRQLRRKGIYNGLPDLADLDEGDLKYHTDFRRVYATLLDRWLNTDPVPILGAAYPQLDFI